LLGRGQYARASVRYGEYSRGVELSFAEPYFLGYHVGAGVNLFWKDQEANNYISYTTNTVGANFRLVFPLNEEIAFTPRYSISQQDIGLPNSLKDCVTATPLTPANCYDNGEASPPIKKELDEGPTLTSAVGYTLTFNTLDNNKIPTSGMFVEFKQDLAGVGGDVRYIRSTIDARQYTEVMPDVVGLLRLQGGHVTSWGGEGLRMLDHFQNSSNLVRGFATGGFGPRDLRCESNSNINCDPLGGSLYWAATAEVQTPLYFLPKEVGVKLAGFVDAGSLWDYKGPTSYNGFTVDLRDSNDGAPIRAAAGFGLLWDSPLGPIRFDFAFPFMKESYDKTQWFRFSGGTSF
jgi:outer membrane protein insertion porin family